LWAKRLRELLWAAGVLAALSLGACASAPAKQGDQAVESDQGTGDGGPAEGGPAATPDSLLAAETVADTSVDGAAPALGVREGAGALSGADTLETERASEPPTDVPVARVYPGFLPGTFATEPVALFPAVRVTLPPEIAGGPEAQDLIDELDRLVRDRLPAEIRIVHSRAPVYAFREWARGKDVGSQSGYLPAILGWQGVPAQDGAIPEVVGNSVEALGDNRGIRYFLFPRSLQIARTGRLRYTAILEAYLLDARGERAVWAGSGRAEGTLTRDAPWQFLRGVVRDAAVAAVADLAARLPGSERPAGGFTQTTP
jgi:hypothetical protein